MRTSIVCAAGIALALVLTDQIAATATTGPSPLMGVNRPTKSDRLSLLTAGTAAPAATVLPKTEPAANPVAKLPEGCETGVSPLAKSASHAPTVLCLS